jgi:hypothetical protein
MNPVQTLKTVIYKSILIHSSSALNVFHFSDYIYICSFHLFCALFCRVHLTLLSFIVLKVFGEEHADKWWSSPTLCIFSSLLSHIPARCKRTTRGNPYNHHSIVSRSLSLPFCLYKHASKAKAVPLHAKKALEGRGGNSYLFSNSALGGGKWSVSPPGRALSPGKGPPVPIVQKAGQRLEEKSFRFCRG